MEYGRQEAGDSAAAGGKAAALNNKRNLCKKVFSVRVSVSYTHEHFPLWQRGARGSGSPLKKRGVRGDFKQNQRVVVRLLPASVSMV